MTQPPASDRGYDSAGYDERVWWRPTHPDGTPRPADRPVEPPYVPRVPRYEGPPPTLRPPANWRPPTVVQAPTARPLPSQDDVAIDRTEAQARTITIGVGMVTGAIALMVLAILCGRLIF